MRRILVTGANKGIGAAIAEKILEQVGDNFVFLGARNLNRGNLAAQSQYYSWSKEFMEARKKRLAGDAMREANTDEVKGLRKEARDLKEVVAEQALASAAASGLETR